MTAEFVHLRLHSEYDVRKGCARLTGGDSVIAQAAAYQQPALALTDTEVMFGAVKFYMSCRNYGVKPIIGCEVKTAENFYLLMLCANKTGYVNLCRLLSRAYDESGFVHSEWMTAETTDGIIALSGAQRGEIGALALRGQQARAKKTAEAWAARFPNRFYLEVWRAGEDDEFLTSASAELARVIGLPVVATHPVQCAREEDVETLEARLCIANGERLSLTSRERPFSETPYLLSGDVMREKFADMPGAIDNALEIAKRCNFMFEFGRTQLPSLGEQGEDSATALRRLAAEGLAAKVAEVDSVYQERLVYEAKIIADMGFSDYFLIVMDFIRWAKAQGIPVGPGRGSGAGSLVAYALDITTLDPIEYGLLFERFLNPDRVSMPDFDVDFCVDGRDAVIDYVAKKYGEAQVSQIVTFGTIGARGAIRDIGRVLGLPYGYCDRVARMVPDGIGLTLSDALVQSKEIAAERDTDDGARLLNLALKAEGLPRNIGTHAGGVLITPRPLEEFCPRYIAADTQTLVSQFDMMDIEKIGLVKFDFLGLRTLTIIDKTEKHLRKTGKVAEDFSLETVPLDDKKTYELYARADMIGVFQCESAGMRDLMRRLVPDRFEDIVALMALYRPGPLSSGDSDLYIQHKKQQPHEWERTVHPAIRAALAETYGVFVYQEQVMEVARLLAGYSLGEADLLRRAMGKKKEDEMAEQQSRFIAGAKTHHNVDAAAAAALFEKINGFAGYGFNKSHAAAYAVLSYRTAYLKTHYPAVFLAAVLSAEAATVDKIRPIIVHARQLNIRILPPDINASERDFYATDDNAIRCGLRVLKGVGDGVIGDIVALRGEKPFVDFFDFCRRAAAGNIGTGVAELLIHAGAFDALEENRAALIEALPWALSGNQTGGSLFATEVTIPAVKAWAEKKKLNLERQVLGFCLSGSFYHLYQSSLDALPLTPLNTLTAEKKSVLVAGVITRLVKSQQLRNSTYGIISIADNTKEMDIRVENDILKNIPAYTMGEDVMVVSVEVSTSRRGDTVMRANTVLPLDHYFQQRLQRLEISLSEKLSPDALKQVLQPAGRCEILLHYANDTLACSAVLATGWKADRVLYERLKNMPGIERIAAVFQ